MKHKLLQILSAALLFIVLCTGMIKAFCFPVDEIPYENRYAEKLISFSPEAFSGQQFQDSMENTLADQVPMAIKAKKLYNIIDTQFAFPAVKALAENGHGYINYRDICFYKDMLVKRPETVSQNQQQLDYVVDLLNSYQASCPDTDFYLYYIESDKDINFETGAKSGFYEYFAQHLLFPAENIARLDISSFEDYHTNFLKSDHHWNSTGSDAAYHAICDMMHLQALESSGTHTEYARYLGTRAAGIEGYPAGDFSVELYRCPQLEISFQGRPIDDYGRIDQFVSGALGTISYGRVFGEDGGEIVFRNEIDGENLLIMGDSYDNPLLKPLASLFKNTYSVDLRAYETDSGKGFVIEDYIAENDIDKVLFIGALEYLTARSW